MGIIEKIAVDDATLAKLEEAAQRHGRTIEEEAAETLRRSAGTLSHAEIMRHFDEIAAMTPKGVKQTDSTRLIREDRDSR
jgi:antitoxin FitA